ncbi:MAG: hypothetical protein U5L09_15245 [Bacteroidales bacterium]|nr:hypothetical protein [Bacteroidales bacterium]
MIKRVDIDALNRKFRDATAETVLYYFLKEFEGKVTFASSLGAEDQVLAHFIAGIDKSASISMLIRAYVSGDLRRAGQNKPTVWHQYQGIFS